MEVDMIEVEEPRYKGSFQIFHIQFMYLATPIRHINYNQLGSSIRVVRRVLVLVFQNLYIGS